MTTDSNEKEPTPIDNGVSARRETVSNRSVQIVHENCEQLKQRSQKFISDGYTHFGYQTVPVQEKSSLVRNVFDSVATHYDVMNDLMSGTLHRLWKRQALAKADIRAHQHILDVAGGTGDLTQRIAKKWGDKVHIVLTDINASMLSVGRDKLINQGLVSSIEYVLADAQQLPFVDNSFDRVTIGFGLRNVTSQMKALQSMFRVLKPGGKLVILEFSKPILPGLKPLYDAYSFHVLPKLGEWVADDADSYRYLAESIRMHPCQETLKEMMQEVGFAQVDYSNLTGGIVALHWGYKI